METTDSKKPKRARSVAYPSNTISHCVDLSKNIHKTFGSITYTDRASMSKEFKISDSHLQGQLSSCVQYGLLEMKSKEGYKTTPLFKRIYTPLPNENIKDSLIECLQSPELYKKLIEIFLNNEVPSTGGLAAILSRNYEITESAAPAASKTFIENLTDLEVLGVNNVLTLDGAFTEVEEVSSSEDNNENASDLLGTKHKEEVKLLPPPIEKQKSGRRDMPIFLDGGDEAVLSVPVNMNREDWERIAKVVNAYL